MKKVLAGILAFVVALGGGAHTFTLLVAGEDLSRTILEKTNNKTALEAYLPPAAERLGFASYTASVSLQTETLADGYCLLTQTVELTGTQAPAAAPDSIPASEGEGRAA